MTAYSLNYLEEAFNKIYLLRNNYFDDQEKTKEFINNIDDFSIVANSFMESLEFQKSFNDIKTLLKIPLSDSNKKLISQLIEITMIKIKKLSLSNNNNIQSRLYSPFNTKSPIIYRRNDQKI